MGGQGRSQNRVVDRLVVERGNKMEDVVGEFTIDRKEWLRGEGVYQSYLLRARDGKRCCVGIYLKACGMSDEELSGVTGANEKPVCDLLPQEAGWLLNWELLGHLYVDNDERSTSESEREERIAEGFARNGIKVNFIG